LDADGKVIGKDATSLYNGNIVSTGKQKYSYEDMQKDIKQLQKKYSDYIHVEVIGTTVDNRNIYDVVLGNPNAKKSVVFQASIHAREYMTSQLVMEQMEYYLDNYNKKYKNKTYKSIFNKVCVHVVAMSNPDGVTISQEGISGIRKASLRKKLKKMYGASNTTIWKANARGVDLNRQFDYKFKCLEKYKNGAYASYGGKKPVSEKESKALVKLVNKVHKSI
jgi:g-D-glutamyl-meso-diaminopimelate peptidase